MVRNSIDIQVTGFIDQDDQFFETYANKEHLVFIGSQSAPIGLSRAVDSLSDKAGYKRPSQMWVELILEGFTDLMARWRVSPETNVEAAMRVLHSSPKKSYDLYDIVGAFDSQSGGIKVGERVAVIVPDDLYLEREPEHCFGNIAGDWGFDFGDFACLCAAVAATKRGEQLFVSEYIDEADKYVRRKVWMIRAMMAFRQTIPRTMVEQADNILYSHKPEED